MFCALAGPLCARCARCCARHNSIRDIGARSETATICVCVCVFAWCIEMRSSEESISHASREHSTEMYAYKKTLFSHLLLRRQHVGAPLQHAVRGIHTPVNHNRRPAAHNERAKLAAATDRCWMRQQCAYDAPRVRTAGIYAIVCN